MIALFENYWPVMLFGAAVVYIIFFRDDQFDRYFRSTPAELPTCFDTDPGPQEQAENDCITCTHRAVCLDDLLPSHVRADRPLRVRMLDDDRGRVIGPLTESLLREPTAFAPGGCHCREGSTCGAPVLFGRQQPCRRPGGVPGQPAPAPSCLNCLDRHWGPCPLLGQRS